MSRQRQIIWLTAIVGAAAIGFLVFQHSATLSSPAQNEAIGSVDGQATPQKPRPLHGIRSSTLTVAAQEIISTDAIAAAPPMAPVAPAAVSAIPVPQTPESSGLSAATVLENMRTTLLQYASTFGENPVGTNPEITSALQGANPKHINFLKQDGNRVDGQGQLVDPWGTPYFFHQVSAREMEIRSAGPDRVMYTGDDLVTRQ